MDIRVDNSLIPGTILRRDQMGNVSGMDFLKKIFYISDGIMLSQIREISAIDSSTLQNWTKRKWVANAKLKRYDIDQLARILTINMLRSCMQLDKIAFLIKYINGNVDDKSDDIIRDSELYDYICRILDELIANDNEKISLTDCIAKVTICYAEKIAGARTRLNTALEIIITAYYAALIKHKADSKLDQLINA